MAALNRFNIDWLSKLDRFGKKLLVVIQEPSENLEAVYDNHSYALWKEENESSWYRLDSEYPTPRKINIFW